MPSRTLLADLPSQVVPGPVPYAAIVPEAADAGAPAACCLVLHGGGGNRDNLVDAKPVLDALMDSGAIAPTVFASASTGELSFYLDDPSGHPLWETFIAEEFLSHIRATYPVRADRASTFITGVSMGGLGSLKIAFQRPDRFGAVAAMEPAIEPALCSAESGARNRFFYPDGVPEIAVGAERDPEIWAANHPANRAIANADAIRTSGLAIYLEVGDRDVLNLHDGTEFLHRVLWDLDISHEYHLVRRGDHVGPSLAGRMAETYRWLGAVASADAEDRPYHLTEREKAWIEWSARGFQGEPAPPIDMLSEGAVHALRAQFAADLADAARSDPTTKRLFGVLPPTR